jgi:hypothetical protein
MEIKESAYDENHLKLNMHIYNDSNIYDITRKPPIILIKEEEFKNNFILMWKMSDKIFEEHKLYYKYHTLEIIKYDDNYPLVINVNYQPYGKTYYHVFTEVLPNALWILSQINNIDNIPILVPDSKFIGNIFKWFDVKNPLYISIDSNVNFIKQKYTECGFPSAEKNKIIRNIVEKKLKLEKKIGIYIHRREITRNIINSDEVFEMFKERYNDIEWKKFDVETIDDTAELFSKALVIVGPHGAGLINMMFAPSNITIIEIMPNTEPNMCYWHQSQLLNNKHIIIPVNYHNLQKQMLLNCNEIKEKLIDL